MEAQPVRVIRGASVVQVQGRWRPASGLVYADNVVLTTVRGAQFRLRLAF